MPQLTRDQRLQCLTLREIGWDYRKIVDRLKVTERQVQTAVTSGHPTPSKRSGRPAKLTPIQVQELITYVTSSKEGRRTSWLGLAIGPFSHWNVSEHAIRYALRQNGFRRCVALAKPPISEANAKIRLTWTRQHVHWSEEQWSKILWTDETWVTGGRHQKQWITRRPGEELDPNCVVEKVRRKAD